MRKREETCTRNRDGRVSTHRTLRTTLRTPTGPAASRPTRTNPNFGDGDAVPRPHAGTDQAEEAAVADRDHKGAVAVAVEQGEAVGAGVVVEKGEAAGEVA